MKKITHFKSNFCQATDVSGGLQLIAGCSLASFQIKSLGMEISILHKHFISKIVMLDKKKYPVTIHKSLGRVNSKRGELIKRSVGRILFLNFAKIKLNFVEFSAKHEP